MFFALTLHQKCCHLAKMAIWIMNKGEFKETPPSKVDGMLVAFSIQSVS